MNNEALRVLLVDDEASLRTPLARYLSNMYGYHVDTAANEEEAWERVLRAEQPYDVALIDDLLTPKPGAEPEPIGIELMARIRERCPETECIVFTGWGMDRALEALQAGAYRYLAKPLNLDELGMTIRMAAEQSQLRQERDLLSATLGISGAMLSELDVGKTLEVITEAVPKLVGAEACAVALLDHATGKVRYDPMIPLGDATVKWHRHLREVQLTKQITEMGELFVLSDVATEAKRVDENLRLAGVKSFAGVPIPGEPQNLGVLYAYSARREAFGTHERRVLQLLAGQAAIALENARLFADTQESAQRSEALYRTSHALSSYLEEEPVIRAILEAVYRTLGCEHVLISTVDDEAETIGIRHGIWHGKFDVFPEWIEMSQYSLDHPDILTDIYRTGRTEIIKGWDDRFNREIYDKFGHERFLRIFMPIKTRNKVIGVVEVGYDKREKGHISEDEVQLLAAFMDQAAVALENARLFDTTRRASEQLSALNQVVLEIGKELSRDALLRRIIEQAMTLVSAEGGRVYLLDATGEHLTLATTAGLSLDLEGQRIGKNEGLTGEILRTRKPQKVADYYRWRKRLRILDAYKLTCVAGAPILVGDRVLGTLVVHDTRPGKRFDDTMLTLLQQFANHAGLALLKAELLERLQAIQQVSTTITSSLESQEVRNCICQAAVELFGVDHSGMVLFDKSLKWGTVEGEYPAQPNTLGTKIPIEGVLAEERLAFNGETLVFSDVEEAVSELGPVLDIWRRLDIRSILVIPIIYQNRILGSFSLDAVGHVRQFTLEEVELCKVFAAHVAVAVENARLFSELVEAKEWREALIEYAFDAVIAIDQDAKITVFNQRAEEMFGWTAEEMIGNTVARLHTDVGKAREIFNVVNREGAITDWDVELKHRDGTRIPALLSAMLIRDSQGNPIGQAGFIRDLRRVNLLEERLRALMQVSQAITGILELDKVLDLIVASTVAVFPAAQGGAIHLYDKRAGTLRIPAITRDYSAEALKALNLRVGEGIAGWVFQNQQPLVVNDTRQDPRYKRIDHPEVRVHRSMICVPLRVREQVIGTLSLNNSDITGAFQSEDLGLLASFADQAAIAIENARLYEREQRRAREAEAMVQVGQAISSTLDLDKIMEIVAQNALLLLGFENSQSTILLIDEKTGDFVRLTRVPPRKDGNGPRPSGGLTSLVIETGEPIVISDVRRDSRVRASVVEEGVRSLIGVPLKVKERTIGVLFANTFWPCDFTQHDIEMLSSFANQAAVAIANAQYFEEIQAGLKQLRSLYEAGSAIISAIDPKRVLEVVVEKACQALEGWRAKIALIAGEGGPTDLISVGFEGGLDTSALIRPDGISAQVMASGELWHTEDVQKASEAVNPVILADGVRAAACVPFSLRGHNIGVMWLHYKEPRRFLPAEIEALRLYANQAAIAYDNARQMRELEHLRRAAERLASVASIQDVLQQIVKSAKEVLVADSAVIWSYDDVRHTFLPDQLVADGIKPELVERFREDEPHPGGTAEIIMERSYLAVPDINDPKYAFLGPTARGLRGAIGVKAFQGIALQVGDEALGVLYVNYGQPRDFSAEDRTILETFAYHAALTLKKARLLDQVSKARDTAKVVAEVSVLEDLRQTLNSIVKGTRDVLGSDAISLYTYDQAADKLGYPPGMMGVWDPEKVTLLPEVLGDSIVFKMLRHDEPYIADNTSTDPLFRNLRFVVDEQIKSCVTVPLKVGTRKVGVMFINYRTSHRFTTDELANIKLFANQAAVAIRNAQLYQAEQRHGQALKAIQTTSAAMSAVLELDDLLPMITDKAASIFSAPATSLMLWDEHRENLVIRAAFDLGDEYKQRQRIARTKVYKLIEERGLGPHVFDIYHEPIGKPELVKRDGLYTALVAPLMIGDELIGVLNIYSRDEPRQFEEKEVELATIFANHAAIAIQNARSYKELKRTKGLVGARTAVAWMGMVSADWWHIVRNKIEAIKGQIKHLRSDLKERVSLDKLEQRLTEIETIADRIQQASITAPLYTEEEAESVPINDLVRERVKQLWEDEPYKSVDCQLDLALDDGATVRASRQWLRRVLDILIDNAVDAVAESHIKLLTISTRLVHGNVEIIITDTGAGIPEEVLPNLFLKPIKKPKGVKGEGMGLLLAQTIVQTYGGDIKAGSPGLAGTTMVVSLPLEA